MGYVHCCSALRKSRSFNLEPDNDRFIACRLDIITRCPCCDNYILQLTRVNVEGEVSFVRKKNLKAIALFTKLKPYILYEEKEIKVQPGKSYLYYNEYGVKKRCYSNFSSLKIGLYDNFETLIPKNNSKDHCFKI